MLSHCLANGARPCSFLSFIRSTDTLTKRYNFEIKFLMGASLRFEQPRCSGIEFQFKKKKRKKKGKRDRKREEVGDLRRAFDVGGEFRERYRTRKNSISPRRCGARGPVTLLSGDEIRRSLSDNSMVRRLKANRLILCTSDSSRSSTLPSSPPRIRRHPRYSA